MSEFTIVNDYPHSPQKVWRALTDPDLVPRWTSAGRGGRPVGFSTAVGTRFKFVARPMPGWDGVVECEVIESLPPNLLRYTWAGDAKDAVTIVSCRLEPLGAGTRFTWEHTGFRGIGGLLVSRMLRSVRTKMLGAPFRAVLDDLEK
jgi:uncharacterized protein YndB with AHSA1/START domain